MDDLSYYGPERPKSSKATNETLDREADVCLDRDFDGRAWTGEAVVTSPNVITIRRDDSLAERIMRLEAKVDQLLSLLTPREPAATPPAVASVTVTAPANPFHAGKQEW